MAVKELRICDICGRHPASPYEAGTWREFDGHRNEEFTHHADLCDKCRATIDACVHDLADVGITNPRAIGQIKELAIKMARRIINNERA